MRSPAEPDAMHPVGVRGRLRPPAWLVAVVVGLASAAVKAWSVRGREPVWWPDSNDYQQIASHGPLSLEFWAGTRTPGVPLLLWLVGEGSTTGGQPDFEQFGQQVEALDGSKFVWAQVGIAALCWALLAGSLVSAVASPRVRWLLAAVVAAMSWTFPVVMWERSVLTESLSMSSLVLLTAAAIQFYRHPRSWAWAGAVLAALAWWMSLRDSHAALVLGASAVVAIWWGWQWGSRSRPVVAQHAVLLAGAVVVAVLTMAGASYGNRSEVPLRNLYAARVLPYEDRVAWFEDRGMPQADQILRPERRYEPAPGLAPVVYVAEDDPVLREWNEWFEAHGRSSYLAWAVAHPEFVVGEPLRNPERAFNNAVGDRSIYAPDDQWRVPVVTDILALSTAQAALVAAGVATWGIWRRRRHPCFAVGVATVALAAPHALLAWHGDAMEPARHLAIPVFQLQLGVLLVLVGALVRSAPGAGVARVQAWGSRGLGQSDGSVGLGVDGDAVRTGDHLVDVASGAAHRGDDAAARVFQVRDAAGAAQLPPVADGALDEDHASSLQERD